MGGHGNKATRLTQVTFAALGVQRGVVKSFFAQKLHVLPASIHHYSISANQLNRQLLRFGPSDCQEHIVHRCFDLRT